MSQPEHVAFWAAVFVYLAGSGLALVGLVFRRERLLGAAVPVCAAGLLIHLATVGIRIWQTGHLPVASRYENVLTGAAVVMLCNLLLLLGRPILKPVLVFAAPFTLLMLGYALLSEPRFTTMSPVLDNLWMFVHVFFAWLAYGPYSVAAAIGTVYLVRTARRYRGLPPERLPALMARLPSPPVLDDLVFRFVVLGFVAHVVMIASGAIWARDLWGRYWGWDPVETWSLLSGLLYGLWIHLRLTLKWHGRRMAALAVVSLVTVLFAFWGTSMFGATSHSLENLPLRGSQPAAGSRPSP